MAASFLKHVDPRAPVEISSGQSENIHLILQHIAKYFNHSPYASFGDVNRRVVMKTSITYSAEQQGWGVIVLPSQRL